MSSAPAPDSPPPLTGSPTDLVDYLVKHLGAEVLSVDVNDDDQGFIVVRIPVGTGEPRERYSVDWTQ